MNYALTVFAIGFAPGLFWLWFFYTRDKLEPEPRLLVATVFIYGILVTLLAAPLEGLVGGLTGIFFAPAVATFVVAVIGAPIIEESSKFLVVRYSVYDNKEFDEPMDGIMYAAAAALGFASLENAFYILSAYLTSPIDAVTTFTFRALISVPAHPLISSIWGFALGQAKFGLTRNPRATILLGLFIAMVFHGVFNFLAGIQPLVGLILIIVVLVPLLWYLVTRDIRVAERESFNR